MTFTVNNVNFLRNHYLFITFYDLSPVNIIGGIVLFILSSLLFCQCKKDETEVPINIPDEIFLHVLIKQGVDINGDGIVTENEAEMVTSLDVSDEYISDLTGIEAFIHLDTLNCSLNLLTMLDVSSVRSLKTLLCYGNRLSALDVLNNTALEQLSCSNNRLISLNISENTALTSLFCGDNKLTSLDVSRNINLTSLSCDLNPIDNIDLLISIVPVILIWNIYGVIIAG